MKIIGNIRQAIEGNGFITVAQFMDEAMYNIHEGYYIKNNPIGHSGDFITAPEISQLFGEMIGVYCADLWLKMGSPKKFNLVEFGPGQGTLMVDLLRATKNVKGFHQACNIHFIERNRRLIKLQKQKFKPYDFPFFWHSNVYELPNDLPLIMIANEFFDCLPINQYVKLDGLWHQRTIGFNNSEFCFFPYPINSQLNKSLQNDHPNAKDFAILEVCYPALEIIQHISKILQKVPGSLLIIDYGYDYDPLKRSSYNSTLQAVMNHKFHPIFNNIGRADLTAHVDFFALKQSALVNQCVIKDTITQADFLNNLGISIRAEILKGKTDLKQAQIIEDGLNRLIDDNQMGKLFKVLSICSPYL